MKVRKWSRGWWEVGGYCLERKEKTKRREKEKKGGVLPTANAVRFRFALDE